MSRTIAALVLALAVQSPLAASATIWEGPGSSPAQENADAALSDFLSGLRARQHAQAEAAETTQRAEILQRFKECLARMERNLSLEGVLIPGASPVRADPPMQRLEDAVRVCLPRVSITLDEMSDARRHPLESERDARLLSFGIMGRGVTVWWEHMENYDGKQYSRPRVEEVRTVAKFDVGDMPTIHSAKSVLMSVRKGDRRFDLNSMKTTDCLACRAPTGNALDRLDFLTDAINVAMLEDREAAKALRELEAGLARLPMGSPERLEAERSALLTREWLRTRTESSAFLTSILEAAADARDNALAAPKQARSESAGG